MIKTKFSIPILPSDLDPSTHKYKGYISHFNKVMPVTFSDNKSDKFTNLVQCYNHSNHIWKNGKRNTENFLQSYGIILDFDGKSEDLHSTIQEFKQSIFASEFAYVLYTSKSHINKGRDSFHVFLPLKRPINNSKSYHDLLKLIGYYIKQQDDLVTDMAVLNDTGNRFIYPSRKEGITTDFKNFRIDFELFKRNDKGKTIKKNSLPIEKTLISLGWFLNIPELKQKLNSYHQRAASQISQVEVRPIDLENKLDLEVVEAAKWYKDHANLFEETTWFKLGQALFNTYGDSAKDLFINMSLNEYNPGDTLETLTKFWNRYQNSKVVDSPIIIKSFLYLIKEQGYTPIYTVEDMELGITQLNLDLEKLREALYKGFKTKSSVSFFTKAKSSGTLTLSTIKYHNTDTSGYKTSLNLSSQEGIILRPTMGDYKVKDFTQLLDQTVDIPIDIKNLYRTYDLYHKDKFVGNALFDSLVYDLTFNASRIEDLHITMISGLWLPNGTEVKKEYPLKVTDIAQVIDYDISNGNIFYHNPIIEYPKELNPSDGYAFERDAKIAASELETTIFKILENDDVAFNFFMDWMAQYVCEYRIKANKCSIILTGVRGSGKNTLIESIVGAMFQTREVNKRDKNIDSTQFGDLFTTKLALLDETELDNEKIEDMLKAASGGEAIKIRRLYANAFHHQPYGYGVVLSNNRRVLNLTDTEIHAADNQFFNKHLEHPLRAKLPHIVDEVYITKRLRAFIDFTLIPRYLKHIKGNPRNYRYGILVPVTAENVQSRKIKDKNVYTTSAASIENFEELYWDLPISNNVLRTKDLNTAQVTLIPHFYALFVKGVVSTQLLKVLERSTKTHRNTTLNAFLSKNKQLGFKLEDTKTMVDGRYMRGFTLSDEILQAFFTREVLQHAKVMLTKKVVAEVNKYYDVKSYVVRYF